MIVVDDAVNDRCVVFADGYNQPAHWKLSILEVNLTAAANHHGRRPGKAQLGHVGLEPFAIREDTMTSCTASDTVVMLAHALTLTADSQSVVDLSVWESSSDADGSSDTVTCLAPVASSRSASII